MFSKRYFLIALLTVLFLPLASFPVETTFAAASSAASSGTAWGILTDIIGCEDTVGVGGGAGAGATAGGSGFVTGRISAACIPQFVGHLITFVYGFVGVFFILNVMYAGYQLAIAYIGESDKGAGKERLKWSIGGLIIATCTFLILDLVLNVILG